MTLQSPVSPSLVEEQTTREDWSNAFGFGSSALYDMSAGRLSTYDFFTWLVSVQALGATDVVFRVDSIKSSKWPVEEALRRLENYLIPGVGLARMSARIGRYGRVDGGTYKLNELARLGEFKRLTTVLEPARERFTVTLRNTFHNPHKNSDEPAWREFAKRIGARVIEDHSVQPITLYERVALYAGAEMNFGVPNGPTAGLIPLTPYPVTIMCDPETTRKGWSGHGVEPGDQMLHALPSHRLVWERADRAGLERLRRSMNL